MSAIAEETRANAPPEVLLCPDGAHVLAGGELKKIGLMGWRALEAFCGVAPGQTVNFRAVFESSGVYADALDAFCDASGPLNLRRARSRNGRGTALNFSVRRAGPDALEGVGEVRRAARESRRPAALSAEQIKALAADFARGKISRGELSAALWMRP